MFLINWFARSLTLGRRHGYTVHPREYINSMWIATHGVNTNN